MLRKLVEQIERILPDLEQAGAQEYLARQFERKNTKPRELYANDPPDALIQGDIVSPVTLFLNDENGSPAEWTGAAMLLSNSCDYEHDTRVLMAACQPLSVYKSYGGLPKIRDNARFDLLYLAAVPQAGDLVVDLSIVQSYPTAYLKSQLEEGKTKRICSLTNAGWYLLIAKLTIHLLRPRSPEESRGNSSDPNLYQRVMEWSAMKLLNLAWRGKKSSAKDS